MLTEETTPRLIQAFRAILDRLPSRRRKQFWALFVCMLFAAGVETITLGCIALFASTVSDPNAVLQSTYIVTAQEFFHSDFLTHKQGLIVTLSILVVGLVVFKNAVLSIVTYWNIRYGAFVDGFFGEKLLRGFMQVPYEWHLYRNPADLILAVNWRYYLGTYFINTALQILSDCSVILFLFITLLVLEPVISFVAIVILGGSSIIIFRSVRKKLDKTAKIRTDREEAVNRQATKVIHGVKDVKVFGREDFFIRDYMKDVYALARHMASLTFFTRLPTWILETVGFVMVTVSICLMLFVMHLSGAKVIGVIALLVVAAWRVLPAVNRILSGFTQLQSSLPYIQKVFQYIKETEPTL